MGKRGLIVLVLSCFLVISLANCTQPAQPSSSATSTQAATPAYKFELKFASPTGMPTDPSTVVMEQSTNQIEKMTAGRVKVKFFPAGSLLSSTDLVDGVQKGVADFGFVTGGWYNFKNLPLLLLHTQLFVYEDKAGAIRAWTYENTLNDILTEYLNSHGYDNVMVLASNYGGAHQWAFKGGSPKLEPKTPADFKGLKVRVGGHLADVLRNYYGIEAISMPPLDVYEALQRGMIEGTMANSALGNWVSMGWADVAKWCIKIDWHPVCFSYLVNKSTFNKLSPEDQAIVRNSITEIARTFALVSAGQEIEAQRLLAAKGVKIHVPTAQEMALWDDPAIIKKYLLDWKNIVGGDYAQRALKVINKYNKNASVDWSIFGL